MAKESTAEKDDDQIVFPEDERNPNEDIDALDAKDKADDDKSVKTDDDAATDSDSATDTKDAKTDDDEVTDEVSETDSRGNMIPKHRYDSVRDRAKEAERRTQELQDRLDAIQNSTETPKSKDEESDIDAQLSQLDTKIAEAYADNELETATRLRAEQRKLEREQYKREMEESDKLSSQQTVEQLKIDKMIDELNSTYAVLDPESDSYDQDIVDEVLELQGSFIASGISPSNALTKAVRYARLEDTLTPAAPKAKDPPAKRETDVKRNIETANKQPPELDKAGMDSNKSGLTETLPDANNLSEEEFDALPDETRRRMRGDVL